jgi:AAA+ ATPase superfamily predicted ATPase
LIDSAELRTFFVIFVQNEAVMMIGRIAEKEKLIKAYESEYSQFVTVYGRRRVGKTFFVRETFNYTFTFEHAGLANSPMKKQLKAWQSSLKNAGRKVALPKTWIEAFDQLKDLIKDDCSSKKVIFIDEMPWMDTLHSGFIAALENFWNGWASGRKDILLIVCGSATSWIINKLIKNHGGLRGRVTTKINIKSFTLKECEEYAEAFKLGMSRRQILESYMIMGGVPFYWTFIDRGKSLAQNIDDMFFNPDGDLHNEYDDLYASLFRNPDPYIKIIGALGTKRVGLSRDEIISAAGVPDNGNVSTMLEDLEYCGFIRKYNHIGFKKKNAIYQLMDPFTLFYFKFMQNNERNDEHFWSHNQGTPLYYNWCGLAFERVCLHHVAQIKAALGIEGIISNVCSWKSESIDSNMKGAQIDLVIERNDNVIDLCEIKYTKEKFTISAEYNENIQNKRARFIEELKPDQAIHLILISASEVHRNDYSDEFQKIIHADALFL